MSNGLPEEYRVKSREFCNLISRQIKTLDCLHLKGINTKSKNKNCSFTQKRFRCKIRTVPYPIRQEGLRQTTIGHDEILLYINGKITPDKRDYFDSNISYRLIINQNLTSNGYCSIAFTQLQLRESIWTSHLLDGDLEAVVDDFLRQTDLGIDCVKKAQRNNSMRSFYGSQVYSSVENI